MQSIPNNLIVVNALPPNDTHPFGDRSAGGPTTVDLNALKVPNLRKLLKIGQINSSKKISSEALNTPFENVFAHLMGWPVIDGKLPFAAHKAYELGLNNKTQSPQGEWAFVTLCNWSVQQGEVRFTADANELGLKTEESSQLLSDMKHYFAEDSIELFYDPSLSPGQWLAFSPHFKEFSAPSIERVRGKIIDGYLIGNGTSKSHPSINTLKRLQNEMQMFLYNHPINNARSEGINSIWISGCGSYPGPQQINEKGNFASGQHIQIIDLLATNNQTQKAFTSQSEVKEFWSTRWEGLDSDLLVEYLKEFKLQSKSTSITLCNDTESVTLQSTSSSITQSWIKVFKLIFSSSKLSSKLKL